MGDEKKKRDTKFKGDVSEVTVLSALVRIGYHVSIPYGENQRYDIVAERDGRFYRIQVKSGRLRKGVALFNPYSSHAHRGRKQRAYIGEIDFFGVYCPDIGRIFLVPVDDVTPNSGSLRWLPSKNAQGKKIRWAAPYLVPVDATPIGVVEKDGVGSEQLTLAVVA